MAALSRAARVLSALALACARGPTVPDDPAESCPWGRPGCAGATPESDEAAHLQLRESMQQHGGNSTENRDGEERVQCPGYEMSPQNYDYGGRTLQTVNAGGESACCSACDTYGSGCGGWSYYSHVCYLKPPNQGSFYYNQGRVAGKKTGTSGYTHSGANTDLGGHTMAYVHVQSEAQCPAKCNAQPGCGGYSYYQGWCYLKPCGQAFYRRQSRVAAKKC